MNLVEARIDGDDITLGQFRLPLDTVRRPPAGATDVVLGIRPEALEEARFAPDASATIDVHVEVPRRWGRGPRRYFLSTRPARGEPRGRGRRDGARRKPVVVQRTRLKTRADPRRRFDPPRGRPVAVPLPFDRATGLSLMDRVPIDGDSEARAERRMIKQAETRERVLDLIDQLVDRDAIPSERALSTDLKVSRLTVRAARRPRARGLPRQAAGETFVSEPKIAQEAPTMTSFTEDMRPRGMQPASRTLEFRALSRPAPASAASFTFPRRSRSSLRGDVRLRLADRETMAIETLHVRQSLVPDLSVRSRGAFVLRAVCGPVRDRARHGPADRRAHRDRRGRMAALGVPLHSPAFVFERVTRSQGDEIVEYVRSAYRGDRYRLVTDSGAAHAGRRR